MKVNFLVNYGWNWDLNQALENKEAISKGKLVDYVASKDISRIDLILRWGGRRRLSGRLPIQAIYSDIYVIDKLWPDYEDQDLYDALQWYQEQDITMGG